MASQEYNYELKVPRDRIAVLIGKKGEIKKELEKLVGIKIKVDSVEGDVFVAGTDPLKLLTSKEIVLAIGRGFNPELAFLLLKPDYGLIVINMQDYAKTPNALIRLKGRIIGREGKSRKIIEEMSMAYISVYGKTVTILGDMDALGLARRAVEMLLSGSLHRNVYKWLEKQRRQRVMQEY